MESQLIYSWIGDWLTLSDARSCMKAELTKYGGVSILLFIGRDTHFKGHQLATGQPGLVPCRRYERIEPSQTATEVPLCHLEAMTGSR